MKRCGIYVRVSTQEQKKHGLSVDNQIQALREYCIQNGFQEVALYNDAGFSARKTYKKRPALQQMLKDCQQKKIDLLLFTKLDRFFRSVPDYYACVEQMNNIPWRAIWEDYETETSAGVFKVNIMLSVAQAEADRTSERIKSAMDYKRAKGDWLGLPPYGYILKNGKLYKDESTKEIVRKAFDLYLETHSSLKVMRMMNSEGFPTNRTQVIRLLFGEAYTGKKNGCVFEPYITMEEYARIQEIKNSNYRSPKGKHSYLFSGVLTCPLCGRKLRADYRKLKSGKEFRYYRCPNKFQTGSDDHWISINEQQLEDNLLENLEGIIKEYNYKISAASTNGHASTEKKITALESKLERIGVRFEEGDISTTEYKEKRKQILDEIASLKVEKNTGIVVLPTNWETVYNQLDREHKSRFWHTILRDVKAHSASDYSVDFL